MSNYFAKLDILSPNAEILLNGNKKFRNSSGAFFTIILIVLSLIGFGYLADKALSRREPIASQSRKRFDTNRAEFNTSEKL